MARTKYCEDVKNKVMANNERYRDRNRTIVMEHLQKSKCVDCGESDPIVLEFDHVRGEKDVAIATMIKNGTKVERLLAEIEKCDIRCANCHRRKSIRELGWHRCLTK